MAWIELHFTFRHLWIIRAWSFVPVKAPKCRYALHVYKCMHVCALCIIRLRSCVCIMRLVTCASMCTLCPHRVYVCMYIYIQLLHVCLCYYVSALYVSVCVMCSCFCIMYLMAQQHNFHLPRFCSVCVHSHMSYLSVCLRSPRVRVYSHVRSAF